MGHLHAVDQAGVAAAFWLAGAAVGAAASSVPWSFWAFWLVAWLALGARHLLLHHERRHHA